MFLILSPSPLALPLSLKINGKISWGEDKKKRLTIYINSKYAFLLLHAYAAIWKERGFLTAKDNPIKYGPQILKLLQAIHLPKEIVVIHCKGHQKGQSKVAQGNKYADKVAKAATTSDIFLGSLIPSLPTELPTPKYTQEEIQWTSNTGTPRDQLDGSNQRDSFMSPQSYNEKSQKPSMNYNNPSTH